LLLLAFGLDTIFNAFGRLSGLAFSGLTVGLSFKGLILVSADEVSSVVVGSFAEKDKTTFSAPSSRLSPSSTGGGEEFEGPASASARSICSAIRSLSRCSSEVVARSFFSDAS